MATSVLVIDDDAGFRALACRILAACGLTVVGEADSVSAATDAAASLRPDAAVVDIMLPDGDGVALARQLSGLPWRPRVLITSSSADAANVDEIGASGAVGFVPKHDLPTAPLDRLLSG
jgi:DNA-binding NarL/FixJ family response regulator